jgi:hypothetical protein
MLPSAQALEVLLLNVASQSVFLGKFAMPSASYPVVFRIVILLGVPKLIAMVCLRLACT